jgi:hypothetical protein
MDEEAMFREVCQLLAGLRLRRRQARSLDGVVRGTVSGAAIALAMEAARLLGATVPSSTTWLVVLACAAVAGVIGWLLPITWRSTARMVDQHYHLKDMTVSALEFSQRHGSDPFIEIQIEEAVKCLQRVQPTAVMPLRAPRLLPLAGLMCAMLIGISLVPTQTDAKLVVDPALRQIVQTQAETLERTMVEDLQILAEQNTSPELKKLAKEMERHVQELKKPEFEQRDVLAKLSEMQQAMAAALEQFDTVKTDADLKELAAALASAKSMQAIAEALQEGEYEKAAEKLEKIDTSELTRKEKETVAENLKNVREKLGHGKEGKLSESARDLQEGLEKENESLSHKGASTAAEVAKSQALNKSINKSLNLQLNRLTESKGAYQSQFMAGGAPKKSELESTKIGKAAANKPLGDEASKLNSQRREESITGIQGEGQSQRETSQSPEGEQQVIRNYQTRYTEFRKQMEEVLENEPLPFGHRETVRNYFESIRPTMGDEPD